jgi:hypothetical protein
LAWRQVGRPVTPARPARRSSSPDRAVADHDLAAKPQPGVDPAGAAGAARALVDPGRSGRPGQACRIDLADGGRERPSSEPEVDTPTTRQATWTGMRPPAVTLTASKRVWGHHPRSSCIARRGARSSVWKLGDPPLGRGQLGPFGAAQARFQAAVDAVLAPPGGDRLVADPRRLGDLGGRPAGSTRSRTLRRNPGG